MNILLKERKPIELRNYQKEAIYALKKEKIKEN